MWIKIKQILASPVFEDEDENRVAEAINAIVWTAIFVTIARNIMIWFTSPEKVGAGLALGGIMIVIVIMVSLLMRSGRVRVAGYTLVGFLWIMTTIVTLRFGATRVDSFSVYALIILMAGLLLTGRGAIIYAIVSIVVGLVVFLLQQNGQISPAPISPTPDATFTVMATRFAVTGILLYLYHNGFSKAMERARANERVLAEQAREVALFRALAENAADAILMCSLGGEITFANRASYTMFGYEHKQQEMVGLDIAALLSPLEGENANQETISAVLKTGSWHGELQQRRKDDSTFYTSSTFFGIRDESGQAVALASITRDVTVQKQAEAAQKRLQQEIIETQRQTLRELSTPVIPVMDRILVMPLVGNLDNTRAKDVTRALLAGIQEHRAKFVILDVTGVSDVDGDVVNHLNKTVHAARLKGAYTIITGIADAVAETIVDLGLDWSDFDARRNLQTGLVTALNKLGFNVSNRQGRNVIQYGGKSQ